MKGIYQKAMSLSTLEPQGNDHVNFKLAYAPLNRNPKSLLSRSPTSSLFGCSGSSKAAARLHSLLARECRWPVRAPVGRGAPCSYLGQCSGTYEVYDHGNSAGIMYIRVCIHIYIYTYTYCMQMCFHVYSNVYVYVHTYIHT